MTKEEFGEKLQKIFHPDDPFPKSEPIEKIIEQYWHKYRVSETLAPLHILEYGVRGGYSAWSFLQAAPKAGYMGVDLYELRLNDTLAHYRNHAEGMLSLAGVEWRIVQFDTRTFKPRGTFFDLFHLDACHDEEGVSLELQVFDCLSTSGAALIDDGAVQAVLGGVAAWMKKAGRSRYLYIDDLRGQVLIPKEEARLEAFAEALSDCAVVRSL
jgi:hypothetical protein